MDGYIYTTAKTYDEALDAFESNHFDCALIDIVLNCGGDKNGIQLYKAIKKISPHTKSILCSQHKAPAIDPHIKYIDKKVSPGDFIKKVISIWENWDM